MSRKQSTAVGIGAAFAGAAVAAFVGMGTANAVIDFDPYQDLFGGPGTDGLSSAQIASNVASDTELALTNPTGAGAFDTAVDAFETSGTSHPITQLIDAIDSNAFVTQFDPDIDGYLGDVGITDPVTGLGGYLVPDDFLGYVAVDLDAFLLNPTGLAPLLLGPLIDLLLGFPAAPA